MTDLRNIALTRQRKELLVAFEKEIYGWLLVHTDHLRTGKTRYAHAAFREGFDYIDNLSELLVDMAAKHIAEIEVPE